jgi:hypothetical protein
MDSGGSPLKVIVPTNIRVQLFDAVVFVVAPLILLVLAIRWHVDFRSNQLLAAAVVSLALGVPYVWWRFMTPTLGATDDALVLRGRLRGVAIPWGDVMKVSQRQTRFSGSMLVIETSHGAHAVFDTLGMTPEQLAAITNLIYEEVQALR